MASQSMISRLPPRCWRTWRTHESGGLCGATCQAAPHSGKPQTRQRVEPEGRKIVAHGAGPWVAGGRRLPAPERGDRRTAARVLPPRSGAEGTVALPVLTHWATILRPAGWEA